MSVATSTAVLLGAGLSAAGAIGGAAISADAASSASNAQQTAASKIAADAKVQATTAAADVNTATAGADKTIADSNTALTAAQQQQLAALQPYIQAGTVSLAQVQQILSSPNLTTPFSFTQADLQNSPGYNYTVQQQQQALQRAAAASGTLGTGGTLKATARLANNLSDTNFNTQFNQALQEYTTNRQTTLDQLSGYQGLVNNGFQATGLQNQDIGNTAQLINANQNKVAAEDIAAGQYTGNAGLTASQIAAQAEAGAAASSGAGSIGVANAVNGGISGALKGISPVIYGLPNSGGGTAAGSMVPGGSFGGIPISSSGSGSVATGNTDDPGSV